MQGPHAHPYKVGAGFKGIMKRLAPGTLDRAHELMKTLVSFSNRGVPSSGTGRLPLFPVQAPFERN
jgi:hypothetical protein